MPITSSSLRQVRSKQPYTPSSAAYTQMRQMQIATAMETSSAKSGVAYLNGVKNTGGNYRQK